MNLSKIKDYFYPPITTFACLHPDENTMAGILFKQGRVISNLHTNKHIFVRFSEEGQDATRTVQDKKITELSDSALQKVNQWEEVKECVESHTRLSTRAVTMCLERHFPGQFTSSAPMHFIGWQFPEKESFPVIRYASWQQFSEQES